MTTLNPQYFRASESCPPSTEPKVGSSNLSGRALRSPAHAGFFELQGQFPSKVRGTTEVPISTDEGRTKVAIAHAEPIRPVTAGRGFR